MYCTANRSVGNFVESVRKIQKIQQKQCKCLLGKRDLGITSLLIHMKNLSPLSKSDVVFNTKNKTTVKMSQKVTELISSPYRPTHL
jgi:ABC-type branched-subunit amino acid transport system ATPase component